VSSEQVDSYIAGVPGWQRENLTRFREAVRRIAPNVEEGWKWDVPVFVLNGHMVCAMSGFAKHTKYNFFDGAALADPDQLFNSGLESKKSRSINLAEGERVAPAALDGLLTEAFAVAVAAPKKPR
jgi:hypothetical protein